jgi:hypothetical protein
MKSNQLSAPRSQQKPAAAEKLPWANVYSPEFADRICEEVANGHTLGRIAAEEPWAPSVRVAHLWMKDYPEFLHGYHEARRVRAEEAAQEMIMLADTAPDLDRLSFQLQARQWTASKLLPKEYGDKKIVESTVNANISTTNQIDVSHLSLEEIRAAELALLKVIDGEATEIDED